MHLNHFSSGGASLDMLPPMPLLCACCFCVQPTPLQLPTSPAASPLPTIERLTSARPPPRIFTADAQATHTIQPKSYQRGAFEMVRDTPPASRCGFADLVHGAAPLPPCVHCATPPGRPYNSPLAHDGERFMVNPRRTSRVPRNFDICCCTSAFGGWSTCVPPTDVSRPKRHSAILLPDRWKQ